MSDGSGTVIIWLVLILTVLFGLGVAFNLIELQFLGYKTNLETHITRQTNGYLTAHQTALRTMKAQYDDLDRQTHITNDADALDAINAQERGIVRQMREEADLIPNDVQPDIQVFLTSR